MVANAVLEGGEVRRRSSSRHAVSIIISIVPSITINRDGDGDDGDDEAIPPC